MRRPGPARCGANPTCLSLEFLPAGCRPLLKQTLLHRSPRGLCSLQQCEPGVGTENPAVPGTSREETLRQLETKHKPQVFW